MRQVRACNLTPSVKCHQFITNFANADQTLKYMNILQEVSNKKTKVISILTEDLSSFFANDKAFVDRIKRNTKRYINIFQSVIDDNMPQRNSDAEEEESVTEIFLKQRKEMVDFNNKNKAE